MLRSKVLQGANYCVDGQKIGSKMCYLRSEMFWVGAKCCQGAKCSGEQSVHQPSEALEGN